jgi:hypothetical protein
VLAFYVMERESERKELWHRLDNESDRAHEAFKVYMCLPPANRSMVQAWRAWTGSPEAKREPPFFRSWYHSHAWSERARARDHHIELLREEGQEEAIREEAARQAQQVEKVRARFNELMAMAYERSIEYLESDDFVEQLRPSDVVQILKIHLETTHKLGGSETDTPGGAAAVDWTEDEQRELDRILDEIEAEGKQDEPNSGSNEGEGPEDARGDQG